MDEIRELSDEVDTSSMLNLGALLVPNIPGLEVHLDLDPRSGIGKSVSLHLNMTIAEVQIFASASNEDHWAIMRDAIVAGLSEQQVNCSVEMGRFGTEIHAVMPTVDLDGNAHVQHVRFLGVRGSRWLVRVVISGDGALANLNQSPSDVTEINNLIAQLVVHRGDEPLPPGERLALRSPDMEADGDKASMKANSGAESKFANFQVRL